MKTKEGDAYSNAQHQHKMGLVDDSDQNFLVENDKNNLIEDNGQSVLTGNQNKEQLKTHKQNSNSNNVSDTPTIVTRSGRVSRPPTYLKDYV